jgi:hypothetical protein
VKDEAHAKATKWGEREVVQPETKLAMGLRIMAGGDPLDLSLIYMLSQRATSTSVYGRWWTQSTNACHFPLTDINKLKILEAELCAAMHHKRFSELADMLSAGRE